MRTAVTLDTLERVGTALADPTRRRILLCLLEGAAYPAELADALGAGRSNVSNHLACLRDCGLVTSEKRGKYVHYRLSDPRVRELLTLAEAVLADVARVSTPARVTGEIDGADSNH